MNLNQVTLPTANIVEAVAFYKAMGFQQIVAANHYARFVCPEGESTFSLHRYDKLLTKHNVVVYFECKDLERQVALLKNRGIEMQQEPKDEAWLWREARLLDPDGNELCLYEAGKNRLNPPWRIND